MNLEIRLRIKKIRPVFGLNPCQTLPLSTQLS